MTFQGQAQASTQLGDSIMVQPIGGYPGFPPPGMYPPPPGSGIPSYPGPAAIHTRFPYGPSFDGLNSHGLTNNAYLNSLLEDNNATQYQIYASGGVGQPPLMPGSVPPGGFPPPGYPPNIQQKA